MYTLLQDVKKHLLIDCSYKCDDEYLEYLIAAAEDAVELSINIPLRNLAVDGFLPSAVQAAVMLLVGNLYANREPVSYASVYKVPYTFDYLISLYKNYKTS